MDATDPGQFDQGLRYLLRRAAVGNEFPEHGAETKDDDERSHDIADAFPDGVDDVADVETAGHAETDADDDKGDEGVQFRPDDEKDQAADADKGEQEGHGIKDREKSPRRAGGNKTTKNKLSVDGGAPRYARRGRLIRALAVQKSIDRADLRVVVLIGLYFIIAVEVFDIGDRVVQF